MDIADSHWAGGGAQVVPAQGFVVCVCGACI